MDKRTRGTKYDESHLVVLSNLVIKYKDIIENKKSDQNIWKLKMSHGTKSKASLML